MNSIAPGWVYVITNPAMPDLLKVGYSMKHPSLRADELYHTNNPHPFVVEYEILVVNPRLVESLVHSELEQFNEGKEWFRCKVSHSIAEIRRVCRINELNILFEQESELNEDEIQISQAIKNNDINLFEHILWGFWPNDNGSSINSVLWNKYHENHNILKDYPSEITNTATTKSILKYTIQQSERLNPFAAGFLTDFILTEGVVANKFEKLQLSELTIFGKNYLLHEKSLIKISKHLVKMEFCRRGLVIFNNSLIEDFIEDLSYFKYNKDIEGVANLNSCYNPIPQQFENINQITQEYYYSFSKIIKNESSAIKKTRLITTAHETIVNLFNSIENEFSKFKNISPLQQSIAKNILSTCNNFKIKIVEIINELHTQLPPDELVDCAHILDDEKEFLIAEKLFFEALAKSNQFNLFDFQINNIYKNFLSFYLRREMFDKALNLRVNYVEKYATPGKYRALAAYTLALIYGADNKFPLLKREQREGSINPVKAIYWCNIAIENFEKIPWKKIYTNERDELVPSHEGAIEFLKKLTGDKNHNHVRQLPFAAQTNLKAGSQNSGKIEKYGVGTEKNKSFIRKIFNF
jgi:hypothetical protein